MLPLDGITVIDLSRALAGPYCTTLLADLGADVIKIENPRSGDPSRSWPPFEDDHSLYFDSVNRNKKSVGLDLYTATGRDLFVHLLEGADVLVENFKSGTLEKMGFGAAELKRINPELVHMAINAYGNAGPLKDQAGLDQVIQGVSGLTSVTGTQDGQTYRVGLPIVDITSGMSAALAVVSLLLGRDRGHAARRASTSLFETALALSVFQGQSALTHGRAPQPQGNNHPSITPYGVYDTATEQIIIAVSTERHWAAFAEIIGRPEMLEDPRFLSGRDRTAHRAELGEIVTQALGRGTAADWIESLAGAGIPCGPIHDYVQAMDSEQTRALGMVRTVRRTDGTELRLLRGPISIEGEATGVYMPPPLLGEHTESVLAEAGIGTEEPFPQAESEDAAGLPVLTSKGARP